MSKTAFEELLESIIDYFKNQSTVSPPPPQEMAKHIGTPAEREVAKLIIDYLKSRGYIFYRRPVRLPVERPPEERMEIPVVGKFYSRQGRNLFIYVKERGDMIDLSLFPAELELFGPECAWRLNNKAVIAADVEEENLDRAELILEENGFRRWDHPEELLVNYFARGDFSVFEEQQTEAPILGF